MFIVYNERMGLQMFTVFIRNGNYSVCFYIGRGLFLNGESKGASEKRVYTTIIISG